MTKRRTNNEKPKSTRKPGRPKRGREVCTPHMIQQIGNMWLQGVSMTKIGHELGIDRKTVAHHLNTTIRPQWREDSRSRLHEDLAKVGLIERTAWERFESQTPAETVEDVEKGLRESKKTGRVSLRIIKQASKSVKRPGQTAWLQVIQWCIEFRAKIHAHYAPTRHHVEHGGEMRVAGMTPSEVDNVMLERLMEQILERRKHQAALDAGRN